MPSNEKFVFMDIPICSNPHFQIHNMTENLGSQQLISTLVGTLSNKRMLQYDRRMGSHSPPSKRFTANPQSARRVTPPPQRPPPGRGHAGDRAPPPPCQYSPSSKKKIHRDEVHQSSSIHVKSRPPMLPDRRIPPKSTSAMYSNERDTKYAPPPPPRGYPKSHQGGYDRPPSPKGMPMKREPVYERNYPNPKRSHADHENFSRKGKPYGHFVSSTPEPMRDGQRVQFNKEDLQNIAIEFRRNIRDSSPTVRHIVNPSDVKLVRRPSEGHHPIFERDEIKPFIRNSHDDIYEKNTFSAEYRKRAPVFKDMENYQITRSRYEGKSSLTSNDRYTLNDRWQKSEAPKMQPMPVDRDRRGQDFVGNSRSITKYADDSKSSRTKSTDRDFRSVTDHRARPDYAIPSHKPLPVSPTDLRHNLSLRRKEALNHDARERIMQRRGNDHPPPPPPLRDDVPHYHMESSHKRPPISRRSRSTSRGRVAHYKADRSSPYGRNHSLERARSKDEYPQRSERYKYDSLPQERREISPKVPYKPSERDRGYRPRGIFRGGFRGFRSRGRPARRIMDGSPKGYRMGGSSFGSRGRQFSPRHK